MLSTPNGLRIKIPAGFNNDNATQSEDDKTIEILSGLRRSPSGGVGYPAIY